MQTLHQIGKQMRIYGLTRDAAIKKWEMERIEQEFFLETAQLIYDIEREMEKEQANDL